MEAVEAQRGALPPPLTPSSPPSPSIPAHPHRQQQIQSTRWPGMGDGTWSSSSCMSSPWGRLASGRAGAVLLRCAASARLLGMGMGLSRGCPAAKSLCFASQEKGVWRGGRHMCMCWAVVTAISLLNFIGVSCCCLLWETTARGEV